MGGGREKETDGRRWEVVGVEEEGEGMVGEGGDRRRRRSSISFILVYHTSSLLVYFIL